MNLFKYIYLTLNLAILNLVISLGMSSEMNDIRIPNDIIYYELATGDRPLGRPALRFRNVCRRDLKIACIEWELGTVRRRSQWLAPCCSIRNHEGREKVKPTDGAHKTSEEAERTI